MRLGSIISETLRNIASGTAHALAMFLAVLFAGTLLGGYEAMSVMRLETEAAVRIRAFADVKTVVGGNVDGLACDRLSDHGDPSFISGAMRSGPQVVPLATKVILGHTIRELGYEPGLQREADYIAIKMPVFSFEKIRGADIALGPEMKSTGECLGIAKTFNEALYKAFIGAGIRLPKHKQMIITVKDEDKKDIIPIAKRFEAQGYRIFATRGTANVLTENGIKVTRTNKLEQPSPNLMDLILGHKIDLVIDTPSQGVEHSKDGFVIRRNAIETGVNVLTSLDTATALVTSLENTDVKKLTLIDIATIDKR